MVPAHMELQGVKCPTGGRDGRPSPLALSGGLPDDDVLLLGPAVDAPVDPPLERIPIRSPSRFGGTLRPLAAGHSSQVWPLVSGSLLLLAIAIVLVLALAVADAGALAVALSRAISARHASTSSECYSSELLSASQGPSSAPLSLSVTRSGSLEGAVLLLDAMAWSKRLRISRLPAAAAAAAAAVAVASAAAAVALPFRRFPPINFALSVLSDTKGALYSRTSPPAIVQRKSGPTRPLAGVERRCAPRILEGLDFLERTVAGHVRSPLWSGK